ncbi:ATP-binding protein [Azospirillum sp. TSO22-1]|uniref:ATP-binding protein n=1 Tax=Azospirillum sp. TSO22-1 TaxID=716789 RepID=UPI000D651CB1|nr:ATP-binding protein [Azospirillum sp. TSO22-1]
MALASPFTGSLHGLDVPPDRVRRIATMLGLPEEGLAAGDGRVVALLGDAEAAADSAHWARPFAAWIEAGPLDDAAVAAQVARAAQADLYACLTTATANQLHLAGRIVHAIDSHRPLTESQRDDIELVLHEAISNAVVHGNLQVEGMKGLSVDALDRFSSALAARMADPAFAARRVEVSCWLAPQGELLVEVADEGSGFVPQNRADAATDASGRGLDLITAIARQVELLDNGRRIRIRFAL